jgi:carbon monoxide dehydrogenase subunit G
MTFEHTFHVAAPPNIVWTCIKDIPTALEHIPGAKFSGTSGALSHSAAFTVPGGAARGTYDLNLAIQSLDDTTRTAVVNVGGDDAAGRGSLRATLRVAVQPAGAGSNIVLHADVEMPGAPTSAPGTTPSSDMPPAFASVASGFAANLERALGR